MKYRLLLIALSLGGMTVIAAGAWYAWSRAAAPPPPALDLSGADPVVAEAVEAAREAVLRAPRSARAWGRLGMVLRAHHFMDEGNLCFTQAERLDPRDPRWPYLRALSMLRGDTEAALPLLRRAADLAEAADGEPAPRLRLAQVHLERGEFDEAAEQARQVVAAHPASGRAYYLLGQLAWQRGDAGAALEHLRQSAALSPRARATHLLLADIHRGRGDAGAAENEERFLAGLAGGEPWPDPYAQEAERLRVDAAAAVEDALQLLAGGRGGEAVRALASAARQHPHSASVRHALGGVLLQLGDLPAAEAELREAARLGPDDAEVHHDLGVARHGLRDYGAAADSFRRALALKPGHYSAHYNLGLCLWRQGDKPGALRELRASVRYKPDFAEGHRTLGEYLAEGGQGAEAVPHLEHAVRLAPADAKARKLLEQARRP